MSSKKTHDEHANKWQQFAQHQENHEVDGNVADESVAQESPVEGLSYPSHAELENQLTALEMRVAEYKDAAVRAKAEADNVCRRAERDIENARKYGIEKLLLDMLPVVDGLVRGLEGAEPQDQQAQLYRKGMLLTLEILEKTLEKHGVTVINPEVGTPFNPQQHEAMGMQSHPEFGSNAVLQVLQKGYELNGRVIRAAMVMVAS